MQGKALTAAQMAQLTTDIVWLSEDPWPFMQSFDIWQPFEGEWAAWSPVRQ